MKNKSNCIICGRSVEDERPRKVCSAGCLAELRRRNAIERHRKGERPKKFCPICGAQIAHPRRHVEGQTCGKTSCYAEIRRRQNIGRNSALALIAAESPTRMPTEQNPCAKNWRFLSPQGILVNCKNLRLWIDQHAVLFTQEELKKTKAGLTLAYVQLSALRPGRATSVSHPDQPVEWHGWTWYEKEKGKK